MKPPRLLLVWCACGLAAVTSVRAQLMNLSFDAGTYFHQDYVNTDLYFDLPDGASTHFDFHFDPSRPRWGGDYVRMRVTEPDGTVVFNQHRGLDAVHFDEGRLYVVFVEENNPSPTNRHYYEFLNLEMEFAPGFVDDEGAVIPPSVWIDPYSELYVYGYSPMIHYVPPGHGGSFRFDQEPTNVTLRFVPVPEPGTYGVAALLMLGAVVGWRRRAARQLAA